MGFAVHWLHSKSKRPIESGWGSGPRKPWDYLKETYNEGLNVGVRLGTPSKLANGFLAVVDVDVKSTDKKHRAEALRAAREILGPNADAAPVVVSGRGNGSRHYYVVTKEPFKTWNPAQSDEIVKVYMPSKRPSKKELASLTDKEIGEGMRLAPAWEVSLYSDGRQVVLPPSIHPDSGRPYQWARHLNGRLPLVEFPKPAAAPSELVVRDLSKEAVNDLKFTQVDLAWLPIADDVRDAIVEGKGVGDRSGYLLHASNALLSAGLSRDEVLSVLTDPKTFLGACAYDHAKTTSRARAAEWLWKYTLNKVMRDRDPSGVFTAPVEVKKLSEDEKKEQDAEFEAMHDWRADIIRTGPKGDGPPKACVENVVLILKNAVSEKIVRRDLFAMRDSYAVDTPWGGKNGAALTDDDVAKIKFWLGTRYRFEPNDKVIFDALVVIATDNAYDPVCDWIDALEPWDGKPRLGTWLRDNFEAEGAPEYLAQVFTKWVVAMIGRAKVPGLKFDWFPIFEGAQGMGKSSFGRLLVRDTYFLDWLPNLGDKDSALALQGMWGVELGELANMRKTEIEVVKAFITRTIDKIRPPYGKRWIESPRRCVFFGTTNRETYLTDDTGNRRIKPVKVGRLDFEKLRADRHQLFAEAVSIWNKVKANPRYFDLSGDAINFEAKIHAEKMVEDEATVMLESFQDFMQKVKRGDAEFDFKRFRILDLFGGVGPLSKWKLDNRHAQFAGKMLKKLGGEKRMIKGARYWKIDEGVGFSDDPDTPDFY
jgi:predicted P-loop ATPase